MCINGLSTHARPLYSIYVAYWINKACTKCGACLPECPTGSIVAGKDQFHIDSDTCADHAACAAVCPVNAIASRKPVQPQKESRT